MHEIIAERNATILRVELNRPAKRNAMTAGMYATFADILNGAAHDERTRVVLWHGAGDSFCAGNDVENFLKPPAGPRDSPQARLMSALIDFDMPPIAAVHGAAIGSGTTRLMHCDFGYAGESPKFQTPFINLALVPEFGSSCSVPARIGHDRAAELILLGLPFDAKRAADLGFVTQGRARSESADDGNGNSAEPCGEACRRAASQQATYETCVSRTDPSGNAG